MSHVGTGEWAEAEGGGCRMRRESGGKMLRWENLGSARQHDTSKWWYSGSTQQHEHFSDKLYANRAPQRFRDVIRGTAVATSHVPDAECIARQARRVNSHGVSSANCRLSRCPNSVPNKGDHFFPHSPFHLLHIKDCHNKVLVCKCAICSAYVRWKFSQ